MAMLKIEDFRDSSRNPVTALPRAEQDVAATLSSVSSVLEQVKNRGCAALAELSERFDGVVPDALRVPHEVMVNALAQLDPTVREALDVLIARARDVHGSQLPAASVVSPGFDATINHRWLPVDRVGLYVPGGQAVYPSSVVMNVVPAQVAGVKSLAIASPPQRDHHGWPHPTILAAAQLLGVEEVYAVGGAQAIGMFAYGVHDDDGALVCSRVSTITGPGNLYVATAKRLVQGTVGIDSEAGPTEIMIIADNTAQPQLVAADLISQAEHDELAAAVLVTDSMVLAEKVAAELNLQVPDTAHAARVKTALNGSQSGIMVVDSLDTAVEVANAYAAEHLEIITADDSALSERITNAGAIFLGAYTPVSLGDYCAGSNHVLPTGGAAAYSSGLNVTSFLRLQQVIRYGREGLSDVAGHVRSLADSEGLPAHGDAVDIRFQQPLS